MAPDGPLDFDDDPEGRGAAGRRQAQPTARLPAAGASRHGWLVGGVGVLVAVVIALNAFGSPERGPRGLTAGGAAPPFAAPLALSRLDGDVNVAVKAGSGDAGAVPACSIRRPDVLNLCALYEQGPVVLAFFAARGEECVEQLDALDAAAARHPDVRFAAVSIRGDRDALRRLIRDRRWRFEVAYDRDGILADAYGVAACPQVAYLRRGGAVQATSLGALSAADLEARVRRLER